jgi:hypothetical protein
MPVDLRDITYGDSPDLFGYFWFKDQNTGHIYTQWFPANTRPDPDLHGIETYLGVNCTRSREQGRAKNASIAEVRVLYADFDAHESSLSKVLAHINTLKLPPTCAVMSGNGYHGYWLLDELCEPERAAKLQAAWPAHVGADPAAKDLARVLRWPGSMNYKYDPPREVTVTLYVPERVYPIEQLERALRTFTVDLTSTTKVADPAKYAQAMLAGLLEDVRNAPEHTRNNTLNKAAFRLGKFVDSLPLAGWHVQDLSEQLLAAAMDAGLEEQEARATIQSGLGKGQDDPAVVEEAPSKGSPSEVAVALADLGYRFSLCKLDDRVYVDDAPITDLQFSCIATALWKKQMVQSVTRLQWVIDTLATQQPFHPVLDYLKALSWDGKDHIAQLASFFSDPDDVFAQFLRRWLVGSCAKASQGVQNRMLVLAGEQNLGKSHFTRWLCPLSRFFTEGAISPDNKDDLIRLITHWVWEVAELGATTRRADVEALKAFLSRERVTVRRPYGRHALEKMACASFIGTVNGAGGFLTDRTGNRRFMVVHVDAIDWGYTTACDPAQVWAQAWALYESGEPWMLTKDEVVLSRVTNKRAEIEDPLEAALHDVIEVTGKLDDRCRSSAIAQTLIDHLRLKDKLQYVMMRQAEFLSRMGAERGRDARGMLWLGVKLKVATQFEIVGERIKAKTPS